jgi:3-methylcrotonyl-CoA carboxylase alpha subunit
LPGFHAGADTGNAGQASAGDDKLLAAAAAVGFPLLIKPSAGGGGKGMHIVQDLAELRQTLPGSRREALAAFGDDTLMLERYLQRPRHVEVQVFADQTGNAVYLLDRDCSIQRRYQKVIEEAPAPGLSDRLRKRMGDAAVAAAKAIDYVGAGTVEFLLDTAQDGSAKDGFYFMEMNTRLQVEHPVTEMILGLDLVEWQLKIAAGEPLPLRQDQIQAQGHAMEARIYAEDPDRDFLPASGRLNRLEFPEHSEDLRIDAGVREGDEVSIHYDPMIAKLIVKAPTREAAAIALCDALENTVVFGLPTNLGFLRRLSGDNQFKAGAVATSFITEREAELRVSESEREQGLLLATLWTVLNAAQNRKQARVMGREPNSPWYALQGFRVNEPFVHVSRIRSTADETHTCKAILTGDAFSVALPSGSVTVKAKLDDELLSVNIDGRSLHARAASYDDQLLVICGRNRWLWTLIDPSAGEDLDPAADRGQLSAPMPAKVIEVLVREGDKVDKGDGLLVLEAMKMEHRINAPFDGLVEAVHFAAGDMVDEGVDLLSFAPVEAKD